MRCDGGWSDVVVHNISRRGMLISSNLPVKRGAYIEIRRANHVIVARIMWNAKGRFGARTQDPIDIEGLIAAATGQQPAGKTEYQAGARPAGANDRRAVDRAAQSRNHGARFQFLALIAAGALVAFLIAEQVGAGLSAPFERARSALTG